MKNTMVIKFNDKILEEQETIIVECYTEEFLLEFKYNDFAKVFYFEFYERSKYAEWSRIKAQKVTTEQGEKILESTQVELAVFITKKYEEFQKQK